MCSVIDRVQQARELWGNCSTLVVSTTNQMQETLSKLKALSRKFRRFLTPKLESTTGWKEILQ